MPWPVSRLILSLYLCTLSILSYGQVDYERTVWTFGYYAKLTFDKNGITDVNDFPLWAYTGSSNYCNSNGQLVISTNGNYIYDGSGIPIDFLESDKPKDGNKNPLILPKNKEETEFYIFYINQQKEVRYATVNIKTRQVKKDSRVLLASSCGKLSATKHCFLDAFWLICSNESNEFLTFLVKPESIGNPVVSKVGKARTSIGDMVSNHTGDKLAISNYYEDWVQIYDFDKRCGEITSATDIPRPDHNNSDRPHGLCFAPNDLSLYVAWSYQNSSLIQYDLENMGNYYSCYSSPQNINDIELGIDGNMYLNVHQNHVPSQRIHILRNPNAIAGGSRVQEDIVTLKDGTAGAFQFPNFINNKLGGNCTGIPKQQNGDIQVSKNRCVDDEITFNATNLALTVDSLRWDFDNPGQPDNTPNQAVVTRRFDQSRTYNVRCYVFYCGNKDSILLPITIVQPEPVLLGNDTTICFGDKLGIGRELNSDSIIWSDGIRAPFRLAEEGKYKVSVYRGGCVFSDSIQIDMHPEIWTSLGKEYSICDIENEAVKLDAGKGFDAYLWTPTGDTTQWIIVREIGEYMVVVDAFTGCSGSGKTIVKRSCDLNVLMPNAFSPNLDGLNEVFKPIINFASKAELVIYNRWGEELHRVSGQDVQWNGYDYPPGVYMYTLVVEGEVDKQPVVRRIHGTFHLIR